MPLLMRLRFLRSLWVLSVLLTGLHCAADAACNLLQREVLRIMSNERPYPRLRHGWGDLDVYYIYLLIHFPSLMGTLSDFAGLSGLT